MAPKSTICAKSESMSPNRYVPKLVKSIVSNISYDNNNVSALGLVIEFTSIQLRTLIIVCGMSSPTHSVLKLSRSVIKFVVT
jgi:hypothetical protein